MSFIYRLITEFCTAVIALHFFSFVSVLVKITASGKDLEADWTLFWSTVLRAMFKIITLIFKRFFTFVTFYLRSSLHDFSTLNEEERFAAVYIGFGEQ